MRRLKYAPAIILILAVSAGVWLLLPEAVNPAQVERVEIANIAGSGVLDQTTFSGEIGPLGKPADVQDTWVFERGTFVSRECEKRCGYPPAPYFTRQKDGSIEFISETHCPGTDAKIVWRGTVDDGTIKGEFTWTKARWYRIIKKKFWFEGTIVAPTTPVARN